MKIPWPQRIWLTVLLLVNVALWVIPSDVVELIARDRHTLLGRYSRVHFFWIIGLGVFFLVNLYTDLAVGAVRRRRQFQLYAMLIAGIPSMLILDFFLRNPQRTHYVRDDVVYHRRANDTFTVDAVDQPDARRTYPNAPPGYRTVTCTYRTDSRGYRNQTNRKMYDLVVLGDSFAAGSRVSDDDVWPLRLTRRTGLSVYNLGMSGYDPFRYATSLVRFGLDLHPRCVVCMLYEGNDFRSTAPHPSPMKPSFSERLMRYVKQSPILNAVDHGMVDLLGPINATHTVPGVDLLDWLPLTVPHTGHPHYYAFAPKQLRDLYPDAETFQRGLRWRCARNQLARMRDECRKRSIRLVIVYAPLKAHVLLPAVAEHLPADKVARFTAISYHGELPKHSETFMKHLMRNIDARETTVRGWCAEEGVAFVSLTAPLRQAAISGTQVYYTYDIHWTPDGHRIAADVIADFLTEMPIPPRSPGNGA